MPLGNTGFEYSYGVVAVGATTLLVVVAFLGFVLRETLGGRHSSARVQKQGGSPFLGQVPMEFGYWVISPLGKWATQLELSPNLFSWSCLILGFIAGVTAAFGQVAAAGGLSILSALLDAVDGMVARSRGVASDAGEVLDATIDRYTEFFYLGGFCIYYRFHAGAMALVLAALLGSYLVSYSQAKGEALGVPVPKGYMRRPERAVYLGAGAFLSPLFSPWLEVVEPSFAQALHYPLLFSILLVAVFANYTAIHRFCFMYRELRRLNR